MYKTSENYIKASKELTRQTSSKIVIDGTEYIDELISHPLISINNTSLIGGFPAKKVTFDMYKVEDLHIAGKEIRVFRGIYVDNKNIEYIPQGIFIAKNDDVTVNESGNKISVVAYDKAVLFDVAQHNQPELTDAFTYGDYINFLLSDIDIELVTSNYPLRDIVMKSLPNVTEGITKRELFSKFAEIIGAICVIDRFGNLSFSRQQETEIKYSNNYGKFEISEEISVINQLSVSTQNVNDDTVYPDNVENAIQYRLISNPFCSSNQSELIALIAPNIIGIKKVKFKLFNALDDYIVDLNDVITVVSDNQTEFYLPVLSYESTGRIKADFSADSVESENSGLENSLSARVRNAEIQIDKQNGIIKLKVSEDELCSLIEQNASNIKFKANKLVFESENFGLDEKGNARLTGTINAMNGNIGGFTIGEWDDENGNTHNGLKKTFDIDGNYITFAIDGTDGSENNHYLLQMFHSDEDGNAVPGEYLFALSVGSVMELDTLNIRTINYVDDIGWLPITYSSGFEDYSDGQKLKYRKVGNMVEIRGACKPTATISGSATECLIGTIAYGPSEEFRSLCQGSYVASWLLTIKPNGNLMFSRYRQSGTYADAPNNAWLPIHETFFID